LGNIREVKIKLF